MSPTSLLHSAFNITATLYIPSPPTHFKLFFFFLLLLSTMGNCIGGNNATAPLPSDVVFKLPSPLPTWPSGGGFATGEIDLGGLQVRKTTSFRQIWTAYDGGTDDLGAIFLEPSSIPDGFSMLGCYAQPNNRPLSGWVLVGKTDAADESGDILKQPTDYTLISPSDLSGAYFWLPTPPNGFVAVGVVVTASSEKPPLDNIRCVRSDFTDEAETESLIWGNDNGVNVYGLRPKTRGTNAKQVSVGTFAIQSNGSTALPLSCLTSKSSTSSAIPNQAQIEAVFKAYAPYIYLHPDEIYLPSSVNWYFNNGALLYTKGDESNPVRVEPNGTNLPQGGSDDGSYWLDLPADEEDKMTVQKGDLQSAEAYLHIKPILGGTATDIQVWMFYPFNGPATAKLGLIEEIKLGEIGEHVGDWEHVTPRISNFDGSLLAVYFSAHSGGRWVDPSELEFQSGGNRFVAYSSLNGHAAYEKAGVVMQGGEDVGIRNDTAKSEKVMDTVARFSVVSTAAAEMIEPPWLNYYRKWGPTTSYDYVEQLDMLENLLPGELRVQLEELLDSLPDEVFGESGPTGPKMKDHWDGDER